MIVEKRAHLYVKMSGKDFGVLLPAVFEHTVVILNACFFLQISLYIDGFLKLELAF